jgi:hypothetical protein
MWIYGTQIKYQYTSDERHNGRYGLESGANAAGFRHKWRCSRVSVSFCPLPFHVFFAVHLRLRVIHEIPTGLCASGKAVDANSVCA